MAAAASRPKTRSVTDHWMVGQENSLLPIGILPTNRDILKEVLFKRNLPENRSIEQMSLVSCKFYNFESKCYDEEGGGCSNRSEDLKCTVFKIKWRYKEAGVETQCDRNIAKKILDIYNLYLAIKKKKSQTSKGAVKSRTEFEASLDCLFDVSRQDAEELIRSDSSRSKQRKEEDIAFLHDQKSDRKQGMGSTDRRHVKIMKNKEKREEKKEAQLKKERHRVEQETDAGFLDMSVESFGAGVNTTNTDKSMESLKEQILPSTSRKRRRTRSGEARLITLQVPENILEETQQIATAKGISPESHVDLIAAFITASGGNLDDFKLSATTGYRTREKVAGLVTEKDKSDFRNICKDKAKKLIVHFDGKLVDELDPKKVNKEKMDRVAILVRSPDLEQQEQLLGIPEMKSGTGMK